MFRLLLFTHNTMSTVDPAHVSFPLSTPSALILPNRTCSVYFEPWLDTLVVEQMCAWQFNDLLCRCELVFTYSAVGLLSYIEGGHNQSLFFSRSFYFHLPISWSVSFLFGSESITASGAGGGAFLLGTTPLISRSGCSFLVLAYPLVCSIS